MILRDGLAVHLRLEELADQIGPGVNAAKRDLLPEVGDGGVGGDGTASRVGSELEQVAYPASEGVGHVGGDAEDVGDHPHRNLLRVLARGVSTASFGEIARQVAAQLARHALVLGHPSMREPREQQSS